MALDIFKIFIVLLLFSGCTVTDASFRNLSKVENLDNGGYLLHLECRRFYEFSYSPCTFYTEYGNIYVRTDEYMPTSFFEWCRLEDFFEYHKAKERSKK